MGKAPRLTYLWISPDGVELRSAEKVWGQECEQSDSMLKAETDPKAVVSTIGPAGERMIPVSGIFSDGEHARVAARCGLGGFGTPNLVHPCAEIGTMPFQNWRKGKWDGADKINGAELSRRFSKGNFRCAGCPIGCGRKVELDGKIIGGPEYETLALLGGGCLIDDLEALCRLNRRCNQLGIDTMEAGSLIGLSMELYEKGLINKEDTGGLELNWGSVPAATELVEQIGKGEGLGALLGQGINAVVKKVAFG